MEQTATACMCEFCLEGPHIGPGHIYTQFLCSDTAAAEHRPGNPLFSQLPCSGTGSTSCTKTTALVRAAGLAGGQREEFYRVQEWYRRDFCGTKARAKGS